MPFGTEKLEWCGWLPDGEKFLICLFVSTQLTNVSYLLIVTYLHGQTHTQTPHDGIGRAYA